MPQSVMLVYGADMLGPALLFAILVWSGLARRAELHAQEARIRARLSGQGQPAPVVIPLAAARTPPRNAA